MDRQLTVAKPALLDALRHLRIGGRTRNAEIVVSFDGDCLTLDGQGMQLRVPATGRWSGMARVPARPLDALVRVPPAGEHIVLRFVDDRCYFGSFSVRGSWQDIAPALIDVPLNADLPTILALRFQHNEVQLKGSGLADRVGNAWKLAESLILRTAPPLAQLGIGADDLRQLLSQKLKQRLTATHDSD